MEKLLHEIKKSLDEMRIIQALEQEKYHDAFTLFKYSDLTKEEFIKLDEETYSDKMKSESNDQNNYDSNETEIIDDKWLQALAIIKDKTSIPSFDTWFQGLKAEVQDKTVKLIMPDNFKRDWLMTRYCDLLDETVQDVYGNEYGIEFVQEEVVK